MKNKNWSISALLKKLFSVKGVRPTESGKQTAKEKYRKEGKDMPEEKKVTEAEEVKETKPAETEEVEEKTEEVKETTPAETEEVEEKAPVVNSTPTGGNGVRVEDLATKEDLRAALSAFEAKLETLAKENEDLKQKLTEANETADKLHKKYEVGDFGDMTSKVRPAKNPQKGETFANYASNFM